MTETLEASELEKAAALLQQGELVAFPTETVYGLGARIFDPQAIARIFQVKGRPSDNPLIAHIAHLKEALVLARDIPKEFYQVAEAFFPGPITVVLRRHASTASIVSSGLDTIALRQPGHPLALKLISLVGEPLVAPSANLSGRPSSTSLEHVLEDFFGKIAAVIDGGECALGLESTVISLYEPSHPVLLRPGAISKEALEEVLGKHVALATEKTLAASPGMKYRHYAPKAALHLVFTRDELEMRLAAAKRRMVLGSDAFPLARATLYKLLRLSDERGDEEIIVFCDKEAQKDAALMNRLRKASMR